MKTAVEKRVDKIILKNRKQSHKREIMYAGKNPDKVLNIKEQIIVPAKVIGVIGKKYNVSYRVINTYLKKVIN